MVDNSKVINQKNSIKKYQVKMAKFKILVRPKNYDFCLNSKSMNIKLRFLTFKAKLALIKLRQAFIKVSIFYYFDPEYYTRIKTNILGQKIDRILRELTFNDLDQQHLIVFFSQKMILVEIRYKIYDNKFFAIIKAFKTWHHYLKSYKHENFVFTNHNNLYCFMNIKNLSF